MHIKNLLPALLLIGTIGATTPAMAMTSRDNGSNTNPALTGGKYDSTEIIRMQKRAEEIRNMDIQNMSPSEKSTLRKEVKGMLKEARAYDEYEHHSSVVYISAGGLIIILLLLILILD